MIIQTIGNIFAYLLFFDDTSISHAKVLIAFLHFLLNECYQINFVDLPFHLSLGFSAVGLPVQSTFVIVEFFLLCIMERREEII